MKTYITCIVAGLSFAIANPAAADWTSYYSIESLQSKENGTYLILSGFQNTICDSNVFLLSSDQPNYEGRTSFLLAAFMAGMKVRVSYYECVGSLIKLGSVRIDDI